MLVRFKKITTPNKIFIKTLQWFQSTKHETTSISFAVLSLTQQNYEQK